MHNSEDWASHQIWEAVKQNNVVFAPWETAFDQLQWSLPIMPRQGPTLLMIQAKFEIEISKKLSPSIVYSNMSFKRKENMEGYKIKRHESEIFAICGRSLPIRIMVSIKILKLLQTLLQKNKNKCPLNLDAHHKHPTYIYQQL